VKTINPLCASSKIFVKYQLKGGLNSILLRTPLYKLSCVSSYTRCDSLQNRFVPFQFAITFYEIFGFSLEATLSRFLIMHIQFKDVISLIKENQKLRAISYTTRLNQHQSAICAPLY